MNLQQTIDLQAYSSFENFMYGAGTSEGARKAWDTRGRGRKPRNPTLAKESGAVDLKKLQEERQKLVSRYEQLGARITRMEKKLASGDEVQNLAGKFLHFLKALGEWIEPYKNLKDLVLTAGLAVWGALHEAHVHAAKLQSLLSWAHSHVAVAVHAATLGSGSAGF